MISLRGIDRTTFELIRLQAVIEGYLPNVADYITPEAYKAAKASIRATGREVVEVFGVGSSESRDAKSVNKIVIDRARILLGSIGGGVPTYDKKANGKFDKLMVPGQSSTVQYFIRVISATAEYERIMFELVLNSLGSLKNSPSVDPDTGVFSGSLENILTYRYTDYRDVSSTDLIEKIIEYRVENVFIEKFSVIKQDIVPLTTIEFTPGVQKSDGTGTTSTDSITVQP